MQQTEYGSFVEYFEADGPSVYFSIHPEMYPAMAGIAPTGRYFVYCIHPVHGSCHFIVEQDDQYAWYSDHPPAFIDGSIITWIGERIQGPRAAT